MLCFKYHKNKTKQKLHKSISRLFLFSWIFLFLSSKEENFTTLLKISPCKFWGPNPNEIGNFCIVGHNYKNEQFFSKVPTLENGDIIQITDLFGNTVEYEVYDKFVVLPTNTDCTSQLTNGKREITLITCTNDNKQRVIVKATEKD